MRHQNVLLGRRQESLRRLALQIPDHPPRHVLNIERALAQIGIVDLAQRLRVIGRHFVENKLHIAKVGLQLAQDFIDQRPVLDHEQMRIENGRVLRPDRLRDPLLHFQNLRAGLD